MDLCRLAGGQESGGGMGETPAVRPAASKMWGTQTAIAALALCIPYIRPARDDLSQALPPVCERRSMPP